MGVGVQVDPQAGAAHGVALRERGGAVGHRIVAADRFGSRVNSAHFVEVLGRLREQIVFEFEVDCTVELGDAGGHLHNLRM